MVKVAMTKLEAAVKEICEEHGEGYEEGAVGYAKDVLYGGCQSGVVGELIYYTDTQAWFDEHYSDIMELREEISEEMGEGINPPADQDMKNWFAWFSFEEVTRRLYPEAG
jgi:hypothetical protein